MLARYLLLSAGMDSMQFDPAAAEERTSESTEAAERHDPLNVQGEPTVTFLVAALVFAVITLFGWLGGISLVQSWLGR